MASQAMSGIGTTFHRWDSDGSAGWEAVAEVTSISGPSMSRETIDVTSLDSLGGYREFISGIRDGGNVTLSVNFTRAGYDKLKADFEDDDRQAYKIVLPDDDTTTFEFEGMVMELPLAIEVADKISCEVNIKVSGKINIHDGSSGQF